jgi:transposase
MAARFVSVDRNTPMLLPPDLRDWVEEDDLVHFVIEAVDRLPLGSFRVNHRGTGAKQFPPHMMLALLIYSYANGLFSSRKIERATHRDVAIRYLTAGTHPDHDTICKFRRENIKAFGSSALKMRRKVSSLGTPWGSLIKRRSHFSLSSSNASMLGGNPPAYSSLRVFLRAIRPA